MRWLFLDDNNISDISCLAGLPNLESLSLAANKVRSFSGSSRWSKLKSLNMGENGLDDISFLKNFPALENLYLNANQIEDFSPVLKLSKLKQLHAIGNFLVEEDKVVQQLKEKGVEVKLQAPACKIG